MSEVKRSPVLATLVFLFTYGSSLFFSILLPLVSSTPVWGQPYMLSNITTSNGGVKSFQISPDSSSVVYRADQDTDEMFELFSVSIEGRGVTKLNGTLVSGGDVLGGDSYKSYRISSDSTTVVYKADQDIAGTVELYSVPILGGSSVKLNGNLVSGGEVKIFDISPDSRNVVYIADQNADDVDELYVVPLHGGTVARLNENLVTGGAVQEFKITPDSGRVVYIADQDYNNRVEIYSVPIAGGGAVKLNDDLVSGGDVFFDSVLDDFSISSDSQRVVYKADQDTDDVYELYSVPSNGGIVIKLNDAIPAGNCGDPSSYYVLGSSYSISPDSQSVVYKRQCYNPEVGSYRHTVLYAVPLNGGNVVELHDPGNASSVEEQICPDSSTVVYETCENTAMVFGGCEYFATPLAGGAVLPLGSVSHFLIGAEKSYIGIFCAADSAKTVYTADADTERMVELFSRSLGGGPATKLNGLLAADIDVATFLVSPDAQKVVFGTRDFNSDNGSIDVLYYVFIDSRAARQITHAAQGAVHGDEGVGYNISPDSTTVVYMSGVSGEELQLYGMDLSKNNKFSWEMFLQAIQRQ